MTGITGTYTIYKNDVMVSKSNNIITEIGKSAILQYLAAGVAEWSSIIGVGAYNTAPQITDKKLYYEITRVPILSKYPVESITASVSASGAVGSSSITLASTSSAGRGYAISGAGVSSSVTVTISNISGNIAYLSHPIESTFTGSTVVIKSPRSIRFRARLPEGVECIIYEIGMFNSSKFSTSSRFEDKIITNFDEDLGPFGWSSGSSVTSFASYTPRLGGTLLKLRPASGASVTATLAETSGVATSVGSASSLPGALSIPTVGYSASNDTGKLLVYSSASGASITVVGQDNSTGVTTNTITILQNTAVPAGGPWIIETQIIKGSTYNDYLSKIEIRARSSASVDLYLDSLKFSFANTTSTFEGLVSRSVLPSPIIKGAEENLEIEYEIFLFP